MMEDMMYLSRPVSKKHPPMPMIDRAAQFAPFAALSGHEELIRETARYTECLMELSDDAKEELDWTLRSLRQGMTVQIVEFVPDERKAGGAYVQRSAVVCQVDAQGQRLIFNDGTYVSFQHLISLEVAG